VSLISSMLTGFRGLRAEIGGAPAPWDDFWYGSVGAGSVSGMRVTPENAKRLGTVVAAVSAKCRAIGTLPCFLYTEVAGQDGKVLAKKHPYYNLLFRRPNSMQTAFEYYEMLQGHLELRGNAYSELLTDSRGVVGEMVPMHPDRVTPELLDNGRLRYRYNDPLTRTTRILLQDEVFHLREWSDYAHVGQSRIAMGVDVMGVALAQQDYVGKYLKNDGSAGVFVTGTNFKDKKDENAYVKAFEESSTGENRHRVRMLPPGVDIKSLGVNPTDMQLLESIKASDAKICSLFNVLPHLIGVDSGKSATYASVEQFNLMHVQQCVLPMAVRWEQCLQRDLIQDDRFYVKFSLAALLRGDNATRMQGYAIAIEHGWLSQDEVRELEDLNPIAGGIGKKYWRPMNWTTLDAPLTAPKNTVQQQVPDPADDESSDDELDESGRSAQRMQLELLALDAASRCVRREINGVLRLADRAMAGGETDTVLPSVHELYSQCWHFACVVLHLAASQQITARQQYDARCQLVLLALADEQDGQQILERTLSDFEVQVPKQLAALAVEGVI
jgi:HK97 family phage portal protein